MPAWAQPVLTIDLVRTGGGLPQLSASGDWQWRVSIEGDGTGSIEAALAFIASGGTDPLVGASGPNTGVSQDWDHEVPADVPASFGNFSWAPNDINGRPEGLDFDLTFDEVLASFGSITFNPQENSEYILITTNGPNTTNSLSSTLTWGGAYDVDGGNQPIAGTDGLLAQGGTNYVGYAGSITKTAIPGDANLNGVVNITDFGTWQTNNGMAGFWQNADFNGTGAVNITDFGIWQTNNGMSATPPGGGAAGLASAGVPEPTSAVLMLMAGTLLLVARIRKR